MSSVLFDDGRHRCIVFNDLVRGDDGIQANQFLIVDDAHSALIDPGGALLYNPLVLAMSAWVKSSQVELILCSHQDPDIIGSVDKWLLYTRATVVCSRLWGRFVPHLVPHFLDHGGSERYLLIDDEGGPIALGDAVIHALPAHFLHSVGNLSFYDPVSRILFSGDVCSGLVPSGEAYAFVDEFEPYRFRMEGFHKRYMASRRALSAWVAMVRELEPAMIVPQHGLPFRGDAMARMLDWLERLDCGVDLLSARGYRLPEALSSAGAGGAAWRVRPQPA